MAEQQFDTSKNYLARFAGTSDPQITQVYADDVLYTKDADVPVDAETAHDLTTIKEFRFKIEEAPSEEEDAEAELRRLPPSLRRTYLKEHPEHEETWAKIRGELFVDSGADAAAKPSKATSDETPVPDEKHPPSGATGRAAGGSSGQGGRGAPGTTKDNSPTPSDGPDRGTADAGGTTPADAAGADADTGGTRARASRTGGS